MQLEKWAVADLLTGVHKWEHSLALRLAPASYSPPHDACRGRKQSGSPQKRWRGWTLADGKVVLQATLRPKG